jgi:hypothetical protein
LKSTAAEAKRDQILTFLGSAVISQRVPLPRYPTHALACLCTPQPSADQEDMSLKLISLVQAHSRFVLLLQSLVHSSFSFPSEPEEYRSKFSLAQTGLRELTFPAPLSICEIDNYKVHETDTGARAKGHRRYASASVNGFCRKITTPTRPKTADTYTIYAKSSPESPVPEPSGRGSCIKRMSKLRCNSKPKPVPPPPPSSEPRSLKYYSAGWRRHCRSVSVSASISDDETQLVRPHRQFASMNASSVSSLSPPATFSRQSIGSSPHDLQMAMSRIRAPILRVFVPCSNMNEAAIAECEEQLIEARLWEHLSTGDIICNFGYVPSTPDDSGSDNDEPTSQQFASRKWLIFNGYNLVLFSPPESPPVDDPLTLPSPFYYSHILGPFTNQIYNLALPPSDFKETPQLMLVYSSTRVKSPHSRAGYATVKKYMWVAKVTRLAHSNLARFGEGEAIGDGWKGEWVLEGEGTWEGRQILIDCIRGCETEKREWEFVREKSGGGSIWLK